MRWPGFYFLGIALSAAATVRAQMPTYHVGRAPTEEEIRAQDITVGPAGNELPPGRGTAAEGAPIYAKRCAQCHGATGKEGGRQFPVLVGPNRLERYPFATTIWDYINTAMPRNLPKIGLRDGTLTADEVYALTAYLFYLNGIIREDAVMDAKSLPRVRMPKRDPHLDRLAPQADDTKR